MIWRLEKELDKIGTVSNFKSAVFPWPNLSSEPAVLKTTSSNYFNVINTFPRIKTLFMRLQLSDIEETYLVPWQFRMSGSDCKMCEDHQSIRGMDKQCQRHKYLTLEPIHRNTWLHELQNTFPKDFVIKDQHNKIIFSYIHIIKNAYIGNIGDVYFENIRILSTR